jgi:hypothetical protein
MAAKLQTSLSQASEPNAYALPAARGGHLRILTGVNCALAKCLKKIAGFREIAQVP